MKYRAIHRPVKYDGAKEDEETVIIIFIAQPDPKLTPYATFVREDGTMSTDLIARFIIIDDAW